MKTNEIIRVALLSAILLVVQVTFSGILYVEFFNFMIVLYAVSFKLKESYLSVIVTSILMILVFGFGLWSIMYLIVFPQYVLIYSYVYKKTNSDIVLGILATFLALISGTLIDLPILISTGVFNKIFLVRFLMGLQVSTGSAICTLISVLFLLKPLEKTLKKICDNNFSKTK